jgi:ComF family protein
LRAIEPMSAEFFCSSCRTPFLNAYPLDEQGRCGLCRAGLRGFDAAYCYGAYGGELRDVIHLFKYDRIKPLARPLGDLLLEALPLDESFDAVAPVPLHWRRRWQRGFNQSEMLGRIVARRRGIPLRDVLRRVRATDAQAGLSHTARRKYVAAAFGVRAGERLDGQRWLLVDDVMTTGSTVAACARALKKAGAARVAVLTVARADRRESAVAPMTAANDDSGGPISDGQ